MSVIGSNIIAGASGTVETGYQIARSLRFNSADSANLTRTPTSNGNQQKFTWSGWVKRGSLGTQTTIFGAYYGGTLRYSGAWFDSSNRLNLYSGVYSTGTSTTTALEYVTTQVFRDPSAWYHIVVSIDTTLATAADRVKIYVNGSQITVFTTSTQPAQNTSTYFNVTTTTMNVGSLGSFDYFNGYLADINWIDGQQLDPTSFGQTDSATGVWVPKAYTGTYGTNGFWLKFDDNSGTTSTTLGKDSSGNSNNWTPNNFSVTAGVGNDSLVDSPTNYGTDTGAGGEVRGNYCTFNPLLVSATLANGALDVSNTTASWQGVGSTLGMQSGKWYWEYTVTVGSSTILGIGNSAYTASSYPGSNANGWGYAQNAVKWNNGSSTSYGASFTTNDVIGVAFDADAGTLTFYKNGVSQGTAYTGLTSGPYFPAAGVISSTTVAANFGQRPFAYTAPSGFKALCTQNLPTPAIGASAGTLASKNFNVATYTGNGTTTGNTQAITGLGFQPDLVWIKSRSSATYTHLLTDSVRGANKILYSPLGDSEATVTNVMNSFDSDGFTVAYNSSYGAAVSNANAATFVGWAWKAGGAAVTNNAGSITSQVSANTAAGFSVVTYTGTGANATVGHGLGVAPKFIIVKNRTTSARDWECWHTGLTSAAYRIRLNTTAIESSAATMWNSTAPTSTVFSIGTDSDVNQSTNNMVAYCFAEIEGFSKFGKYTGNANADGPFVYCGFRPRFIMVKRIDTAVDSWIIYDTARSQYNVSNSALYPSGANSETTETNNPFDILSNGFKLRGSGTTTNASSGYLFAAFAEAPFNYARAR